VRLVLASPELSDHGAEHAPDFLCLYDQTICTGCINQSRFLSNIQLRTPLATGSLGDTQKLHVFPA
jgi:hypothetical protein